MDLSKAFIISVDYKDTKNPPLWDQRFFSEIVLIDKTNSPLSPLLYQLKDSAIHLSDHLHYFKQGIPSPSRDAFVFLGDVAVIDKKKKEIHLNNKNVVAYNYLIIASGTKPTVYGATCEEEFTAGVQTLIDALRVREKIPATFSNPTQSAKLSQLFCYEPHSIIASKEIEKIVHPYMALEDHATTDLASMNKRLYQVQV